MCDVGICWTLQCHLSCLTDDVVGSQKVNLPTNFWVELEWSWKAKRKTSMLQSILSSVMPSKQLRWTM